MIELSIFLREQLVGRSSFDKDEVRIGRTPDNEVQIDNLGLSRYHASIEDVGDAYVIKDFGSPNGTYVNGQRVVGRRALDDGDRIGVGKFSILFHGERRVTGGSMKVSDEAAYAVAGATLVTRGAPERRDRPCPWAAYLEGPAPAPRAAPPTHALARDFFFLGSAPDCHLVIEKAPARAAAIVRAWNGFSILALAPGVLRNKTAVDLPVELRTDDEIEVGGTRLRFKVGRPDAGP